MCEKKRRHLQKDERRVQLGLYAFQRFYEKSMSSKKTKTYQEFCDTRHNAPGDINSAELRGSSRGRSNSQQVDSPRHQDHSPHQQPRRQRARSRSNRERRQKKALSKDKKDRKRRRSTSPPPRGRSCSRKRDSHGDKRTLQLTDEDIPASVLAIKKLKDNSNSFLSREISRMRSQQPQNRGA